MPPTVDWRQVSAADYQVPPDRPLSDLTAELTELLGSPDAELRDRIALSVLGTWIERGVYDDLMRGLGDGIATGLLTGIGEAGTDSVFRRSFSALVLAEILTRDARRPLVPRAKVLEWGDRLATWYLAERDERTAVPGKGWAHAIAHGADALAALARSPHCEAGELLVVLDVIGERVTRVPPAVWTAGEPDRLALTTLHVLRRGLVPHDLVEPWLERIAVAAQRRPEGDGPDVHLLRGNPAAYLRSLYLQLALGPEQPSGRSDLLLLVVNHLRRTHPAYLGPSRHRAGPPPQA